MSDVDEYLTEFSYRTERGPRPTYVVIDEYHFISNLALWMFFALHPLYQREVSIRWHFALLDGDDE